MSNGIGFGQAEKPKLEIAKVITWKSTEKGFQWYDKEKKKQMPIPLPIKFIGLEQRVKITGWDDASESGIYSNHVANLKEELVVKSFKGGELARGLYSDIKLDIKAKGGKYTQVLLASFNGELVSFEFAGSANEAWIEFGQSFQGYNILKFPISVKKTTEGKTAGNKYNKPLFEQDQGEIPAKEYDDAMLYKQVVDDYNTGIKEFYAKTNEVSEKMEKAVDFDAKLKETAPKQLAEDKEEMKPSDLPF